MIVHPRRYAHPDVQTLVAAVQEEYVRLYGGHDASRMHTEDFDPPQGLFLVGYAADGVPVAMGGWRRLPDHPGLPGEQTAELKRMFVVPQRRGQGLAGELLGHLEQSAREAGVGYLVLETGDAQPVAVALYRSRGYAEVDGSPFGHYADSPHSIYLGKALTER